MKKTILLIGLMTFVSLQLHSMEPLEKKIIKKDISIPTLQDLSKKTWLQKQLIPLLRQNIGNFTITHNKIKELTQNTSPDILTSLGAQFYEMCKPALTNLFLKHPIVSLAEPRTSDYFIDHIEFDPSGRYCIAIKKHIDYESKKKQIDVYSVPHFNLETTLKVHCNYTRFSPQGKFLSAYQKKSGIITLFDTHNNFISHTFNAPNSVYAFNTPETILFSTQENGSCHMWDTNTKQKIESNVTIPGQMSTIEPQGNYVIYCTINPGGQRPIDKITLLTPHNQQLSTIIIDASQDEISSGYCNFALHPESKLFAMSSYGKIFIWNFETKKLIEKFEHEDNVNSLVFDKSGKFLASASDDWTARLWNIETGKDSMLGIEDSRHIVTSVTFSPQNNILFSKDSCIRLWDLSRPKPLHIGSTSPDVERGNITVYPITSQGLLFSGTTSENIWCAPTPNLFDLHQLVWMYAAHWAQKNLKGEQLKNYMTDLSNTIEMLFPQHTNLMKNHLHKILKP